MQDDNGHFSPGAIQHVHGGGQTHVTNGQPADFASPVDFLHAFRRRGLLAVSVGLVLSTAVGAAVWLSQGAVYETASILKISAAAPELVFDTAHSNSPVDFEVFKGTQTELVKSRFVLLAALRDKDVARLGLLQREERPVEWLMDNLQVTTPKDTEIMRVSLRADDPAETATLVNAVVTAYLTEVVNFEQNRRRARLDEVDRVYTDKESELRRKRSVLKDLAEQLGTGDSEALTAKQRILMEELGGLRMQLVQTQSQLWRTEGDLKAQQAVAARVEEGQEVPSLELELAIAQDPIYATLMDDRFSVARRRADMLGSLKQRASQKAAEKRYAGMLEAIDNELESRRAEIQQRLRNLEPMAAQDRIQQLTIEAEVLRDLETRITAEVTKLKAEIDKIGNRSIDVEMMRGEIEQLDDVLRSIAKEREELRVELRSRSRVEVLQPAQADVPASQTLRQALTGLAALFAFLVPLVVILWKDVADRRVNSSREVSRVAGLDVVGSLPVIPHRAVRQRIGSDRRSVRYQYWHSVLCESVSKIASELVNQGDEEPIRMVLVTSAVGGEGKTTLATQLAMSLARIGRTVTLVDADLRRPMIHDVFQRSRTPGFCERLRGESELSEVVQATDVKNLSIVAAGKWDQVAHEQLGHPDTAVLFQQLRGLAQYIIVDTGPVLPVADTGFLCPHVDAVVLAVRRDVSQLPQVRAAHDFVARSGVHIWGAVVADGGPTHYRDGRYLPQYAS